MNTAVLKPKSNHGTRGSRVERISENLEPYARVIIPGYVSPRARKPVNELTLSRVVREASFTCQKISLPIRIVRG